MVSSKYIIFCLSWSSTFQSSTQIYNFHTSVRKFSHGQSSEFFPFFSFSLLLLKSRVTFFLKNLSWGNTCICVFLHPDSSSIKSCDTSLGFYWDLWRKQVSRKVYRDILKEETSSSLIKSILELCDMKAVSTLEASHSSRIALELTAFRLRTIQVLVA